jgi:hypothetical protein
MHNELTVEYNMTNWREATKDCNFSSFYTGIHQNDTVYLFNPSIMSESWIWDNQEALASVRRGLKDAAEGRISKINLKNL